MNDELIHTIRMQLAHIFASYGDEPEELAYKLECLVCEWYDKGKRSEKIGTQRTA